MTEKILGKIDFAEYGMYADRPFLVGIQLGFSLNGGKEGIMDGGRYTVNLHKDYRWDNEGDREKTVTAYVERVVELLKEAKVKYVSELLGKPVEVTIENRTFKDFRILTEVL